MITTHITHNTTPVITGKNFTVIFLKHIYEKTFFEKKRKMKIY